MRIYFSKMRLLKKIAGSAFFIIFFASPAISQTIALYAGKGTCGECVEETRKSLSEMVSDKYKIALIGAETILANHWQEDTALLIIPGGKASDYAAALDGEGNKLIRHYVEQGGSYLGLCAGAYYASEFVEFAKGTEFEIIKKRELAFFKGKMIGPALKPYDEESESGICGAKISFNTKNSDDLPATTILYHNGGGYFSGNYSNTKILATYDDLQEKPPAVIEVLVGKGNVVLSGVHFEFNSKILVDLNKNKSFSVEKMEYRRKRILRSILSLLKLELAPL